MSFVLKFSEFKVYKLWLELAWLTYNEMSSVAVSSRVALIKFLHNRIVINYYTSLFRWEYAGQNEQHKQ